MSKKRYNGFEIGPIRPPNESDSLLLRITRNCPWNFCTFCPAYKTKNFSLRPVEHVIQDIDSIKKFTDLILRINQEKKLVSYETLLKEKQKTDSKNRIAFNMASAWVRSGMRSIFIQDGNSLVRKPSEMITILEHLKKSFPTVSRITSYARSHTIARISDENLMVMAKAGLNRIHIGLESGSDRILKHVKKGCRKQDHIKAGLKVKKAGIQLSEYIMPGLGGQTYSKENAIETADAINRINPDFIRFRSFAVPNRVKQFTNISKKWFVQSTDTDIAKEILVFLESLDDITSIIKSDHILNLFQDVEGKMPEDLQKMKSVIKTYLDMDLESHMIFQVGRRRGLFTSVKDMEDPDKTIYIKQFCKDAGITTSNFEEKTQEMLQQFV